MTGALWRLGSYITETTVLNVYVCVILFVPQSIVMTKNWWCINLITSNLTVCLILLTFRYREDYFTQFLTTILLPTAYQIFANMHNTLSVGLSMGYRWWEMLAVLCAFYILQCVWSSLHSIYYTVSLWKHQIKSTGPQNGSGSYIYPIKF